LATLKAQERTALALQAGGYSYAEICGACGWTYTKVNRCLAEGRDRLRQLGAMD
jgi:DNA-directed RNA polymerase specialized sigma24 family protein